MHTVRLQSAPSKVIEKDDGKQFMTMGVYAPGLIRWAKAGFNPREPKLAFDLADAFHIKREVMVALLSGEVDYTVEGEDVVFGWPDDPTGGK